MRSIFSPEQFKKNAQCELTLDHPVIRQVFGKFKRIDVIYRKMPQQQLVLVIEVDDLPSDYPFVHTVPYPDKRSTVMIPWNFVISFAVEI